jgi:hypothetical protein
MRKVVAYYGSRTSGRDLRGNGGWGAAGIKGSRLTIMRLCRQQNRRRLLPSG